MINEIRGLQDCVKKLTNIRKALVHIVSNQKLDCSLISAKGLCEWLDSREEKARFLEQRAPIQYPVLPR